MCINKQSPDIAGGLHVGNGAWTSMPVTKASCSAAARLKPRAVSGLLLTLLEVPRIGQFALALWGLQVLRMVRIIKLLRAPLVKDLASMLCGAPWARLRFSGCSSCS